MNYADYIPVWNKLDENQRNTIISSSVRRTFKKGAFLHHGSSECTGLMLILSGQIRAYTTSSDGREITLYRLFDRDICLFSASCIMNSIQFDITLAAEKDSEVVVIPSETYKKIMNVSAPLANFTNEVMASRFSDVMWLVDQVMWKSFDKRLAAFLLEESALEGSAVLKTTHELIAKHLGSAREVVTRMLRYFQSEGMVKLSRGAIELSDPEALEALRDG